jgi:hypothetical protein
VPDNYIIVEGGVVQNYPSLPIFDLDCFRDQFPNQQTLNEIEDIIDRIEFHKLQDVLGEIYTRAQVRAYEIGEMMENERNTTRIKEMNLAERVLLYETDQMSEQEMISLFQDLVDTGMAWKLQGHYGRTSMILLDAGVIAPPEDVLR